MKRFIILFLICLLIITTSVYAAVEQYILYKSPYPIIINGQALESDLPVLNYKGYTYIPLKKVGEALGVPVEFKDNKIMIGSEVKKDNHSNILNIFQENGIWYANGRWLVEILSKKYPDKDIGLAPCSEDNQNIGILMFDNKSISLEKKVDSNGNIFFNITAVIENQLLLPSDLINSSI